jgi:hypothetical protein
LGLPLIATLAQSLELGGGGDNDAETQVRMRFELEHYLSPDGAE